MYFAQFQTNFMSYPLGNKFDVGDEVYFLGNRAKVIKAYERHYHYGIDTSYWMYDIEYEDGGVLDEIAEEALSPAMPKLNRRTCECGAWAVPWAKDMHSYWCPDFGKSRG